MLPHLKHLLYPKMIVSFTKWCLRAEQRISVSRPASLRQPLLRHGGVSGQDNAFNQLSLLLPLLLLSSDEVKGTYFCLPDSSELGKEFAFTSRSKRRWLTRKPILCLFESNANIKSFEFYINIGFMRIETALLQPTISNVLIWGLSEKEPCAFSLCLSLLCVSQSPGQFNRKCIGGVSKHKSHTRAVLSVLGSREFIPSLDLLSLILAMLVAAYSQCLQNYK